MSALLEGVSYGKSYIRSLPRYVPGRAASSVAQEFGFAEDEVLKLASNENPLGIPGSAQQAIMQLAATASGSYPDPDAVALKAALAARFGVPADWITVGNGSSEILDMAARSFAGAGDTVVMSQYSFALYELVTKAAGATPHVVPSRAFGHDLEAMLAAVDSSTRLVFVANPNNPTGTLLDPAEIERFLARVPEEVVVVLDEAYTEYLPEALQTDAAGLLKRYPNLVVLHTFSKAYGLAGLRIGYALAQPHLIETLNRVRGAFNTSSFAQAAAVAALGDEDFLRCTRELNETGLQQLYRGFERLGLNFLPGAGNFVLVQVGDGAAVARELLQHAVIVRPVANYDLPEWLRITVGLPEQNQRFLGALERILTGR